LGCDGLYIRWREVIIMDEYMGVHVGDRIRIEYMEDEPRYWGKVGNVKRIDDMGQLHGTWGGLAVNLDVDQIAIIREE